MQSRFPQVRSLLMSVVASLFVLTMLATSAAVAGDWTYWRGPRFDGTAQANGLPDTWDYKGGEGSNVLWKREDIGGPCTPIVMNGRSTMSSPICVRSPCVGQFRRASSTSTGISTRGKSAGSASLRRFFFRS